MKFKKGDTVRVVRDDIGLIHVGKTFVIDEVDENALYSYRCAKDKIWFSGDELELVKRAEDEYMIGSFEPHAPGVIYVSDFNTLSGNRLDASQGTPLDEQERQCEPVEQEYGDEVKFKKITFKKPNIFLRKIKLSNVNLSMPMYFYDWYHSSVAVPPIIYFLNKIPMYKFMTQKMQAEFRKLIKEDYKEHEKKISNLIDEYAEATDKQFKKVSEKLQQEKKLIEEELEEAKQDLSEDYDIQSERLKASVEKIEEDYIKRREDILHELAALRAEAEALRTANEVKQQAHNAKLDSLQAVINNLEAELHHRDVFLESLIGVIKENKLKFPENLSVNLGKTCKN